MNTIKKIAMRVINTSAGAIFCLNFLAACSALPAPPIHPVQYDFGPGPAVALALVPPAATQAATRMPLVVADIESPGIAEGNTALQYRLAYDTSQQLRAYQQARWSQPPSVLVQQAVLSELALHRPVLSSGAARAAARVGTPGAMVLRLELEEFSQVFASPVQSSGVLRLRATLAEAGPQGEMLRGQRVFRTQISASSADAAGGTAALAEAAAQVARELADWVDQTAR